MDCCTAEGRQLGIFINSVSDMLSSLGKKMKLGSTDITVLFCVTGVTERSFNITHVGAGCIL
jgi:hypothetical protein